MRDEYNFSTAVKKSACSPRRWEDGYHSVWTIRQSAISSLYRLKKDSPISCLSIPTLPIV